MVDNRRAWGFGLLVLATALGIWATVLWTSERDRAVTDRRVNDYAQIYGADYRDTEANQTGALTAAGAAALATVCGVILIAVAPPRPTPAAPQSPQDQIPT